MLTLRPIVAFGLLLGAALAAAPSALAQWSTDASLNSPIGAAPGDTVQAKVVAGPDGGSYVSWFDNRTGGYDVYLQRLDRDGVARWATDGILIADLANSSTQDYGLVSDGAGGVVLAFLDTRFGGTVVTATRVLADGSQPWGATGVQVSVGGSVNKPTIDRSGDGRPTVAWIRDNTTEVQRLELDGTKVWASPVSLTAPSAQLWVADIEPGDGDSVIVSMVRQTGFAGAKTLWAQKLSGTGASLWQADHVKVFQTGSLQFGNFPSFASDGAGGAVFAFYTTGPLQSFVQRVAANGTVSFGTNGVAVTATSTGRERTSPGFAYDASSQRTYVAWQERISNTSQYGVVAQAFDGAGARLWGANGVVLEPVVANFGTRDVECDLFPAADGLPTFSWVRDVAFNNGTLFASRRLGDGTSAWPATAVVSSAPSGHSRTDGAALGESLVLVWEDSRDGNTNIYGQALRADGSLGPPPPVDVLGDLDGDGQVNAADLAILLGAWGPAKGNPADLNNDGTVDATDLAVLLGAW
jgi:hypothetical protein